MAIYRCNFVTDLFIICSYMRILSKVIKVSRQVLTLLQNQTFIIFLRVSSCRCFISNNHSVWYWLVFFNLNLMNDVNVNHPKDVPKGMVVNYVTFVRDCRVCVSTILEKALVRPNFMGTAPHCSNVVNGTMSRCIFLSDISFSLFIDAIYLMAHDHGIRITVS